MPGIGPHQQKRLPYRRARAAPRLKRCPAPGSPRPGVPGQPSLLGHRGQPGPEALGQVLHVPDLALVRPQRRDLAREGPGHVHVVVRVGAARDPDLAHGPGGQRLALEQLGKRERVPRVRVDGVQGGRAHRPVVGMADPDPGVAPLRAGAEQPVRPDLPDHPGQVPAQVQGGLHPAVRVAQEAHVVHADALGRGHLLGPAQGRHLLPGEILVETAGVAVGHHAVDHLDPGLRPARDGSRGREVHVVGVGRDGQDPADLGVIEHARHPRQGARGRAAAPPARATRRGPGSGWPWSGSAS